MKRLSRWFFPENSTSEQHAVGRMLFLRGIAVIYLIAIISWWVQADLLVGKNGLVPADSFIGRLHDSGVSFFEYPVVGTNFHLLCAVGCVLAICVLAGFFSGPALAFLWLIYLSLLNTGGVFMSFQWDILLLETGFLAIFLAPWRRIRLSWQNPAPLEPLGQQVMLWLCWVLIAKLMFFSGWVKVAWAGDQYPEWWPDHTAMTYHYFTQPLPTWTAWWMHQLPAWFQQFSLWPMYFVELVLPFFVIFGPRMRRVAAIGFTGLMVLILLTGNYTYFNWLTIVLCFPLVADCLWPGRLLRWLRIRKIDLTGSVRRTYPVGSIWGVVARAPTILLIGWLNFYTILTDLHRAPNPVLKSDFTPDFLKQVAEKTGPWRLVSGYGLFRTMTTDRPEIVLEGSYDGFSWKEYDFRWKPDKLDARPRFVAPHQPRVAWQMWFFALERGYHPQSRNSGWFSSIVTKLLQGEESVQAFFVENPFPHDPPPRFIRARLYAYEFTTIAEKRETGDWWKRTFVREFLPPVSLR
ncbi:MAG: lipase maturation factor family protein [Verrucomicrobiales bacterium]|nr:lipase maturation factor family protein [Verrucomicrobiales bacterium]